MLLADLGVIPLMKTADQIFSVRLDNGAKLSVGSYINLIIQEAGRLVNVSEQRRAESKALRVSGEQHGRHDRKDLMKEKRKTVWLSGLVAPEGGKTEIHPVRRSELVFPETQQSCFSIFHFTFFFTRKFSAKWKTFYNRVQAKSGKKNPK